jgi:nicotinamidase-related amidase
VVFLLADLQQPIQIPIMARTADQFERFIERTYEQLGRSLRAAPPLEVSRAALLVIDMQNQFVHPDGDLYLPGSRHIVKRIRRLVDMFHDRKRPVIYTRHEHAPDGSDLGMMDAWWSGAHIYQGSWNAEILDKLAPLEGDQIISKNRYNGFHGTNLDTLLKGQKVEQVVITGVMTNLCCESTARDAFMRDYAVYFCLDGTATISDELALCSIQNLAYGFAYIVKAGEIADSFDSKPA